MRTGISTDIVVNMKCMFLGLMKNPRLNNLAYPFREGPRLRHDKGQPECLHTAHKFTACWLLADGQMGEQYSNYMSCV